MRRGLMISLVGSAIVAALAFGPTAQAAGKVIYNGGFDKDHKLQFAVETIMGQKMFEPVFVQFDLHCPSTGQTIRSEYDFGDWQQPMDGNTFSLPLSDSFSRFDWEGTVGKKKASGTLDAGVPAYVNEQGGPGAEDCPTVDTSWTAKAGSLGLPRGGHALLHFTVTRTPDGHVQVVRRSTGP